MRLRLAEVLRRAKDAREHQQREVRVRLAYALYRDVLRELREPDHPEDPELLIDAALSAEDSP